MPTLNLELAYVETRVQPQARLSVGRELDPGLAPWRPLWRGGGHKSTDDTTAAWRTVCVGLVLHTDFHTCCGPEHVKRRDLLIGTGGLLGTWGLGRRARSAWPTAGRACETTVTSCSATSRVAGAC